MLALAKRSWSLWLLVAMCACGGDIGEGEGGGDGGVDGAALVVEPGEANLNVEDGQIVEQAYQVFLVDAEGVRTEVTAEASLRVDDRGLGDFDGAVFRPSGRRGGRGVVTAGFDGLSATAAVIVRVADTRVADSAPADAPDLFDAAADDASLAPEVVYPEDGTTVPLNLGDFEAHWLPAAGTDLFELSLRSAYAEVTVYTTGTAAGAGVWSAFLPEEWGVVGASAADGALELSVRALSSTAPERAGAATLGIGVTAQDIEGGIYYWAAAGSRPAGIYRHDMGAVGQQAEAFYTSEDAAAERPTNTCVACHVLSRDGRRMAIGYNGGGMEASIIDVASRTPILPTDGTFKWNFGSFQPGAERIVTVSGGAMSLRQVSDGAVVTTVPTEGYATHPDFAPEGDALVYVQVGAPSNDWSFTGGQIMIQSFDAAMTTFGAPEVLVAAEAGANAYYPSFSPDGKWVIYNRSTENAYDNATAELYVVAADGSTAPQLLAVPNRASGLTNSWARWAPFAQTITTEQGSEPLFWFTFSSKRAFGVRLAAGQPQIWMAPFYPERAAAGMPASGPAFRLPFQDIGTSNHIAQWTEEVVPID